MLAQSEAAAGIDVGIRASLQDRLELGPIPMMEFSLRLEELKFDIGQLDPVGFSSHFLKYVECGAFLATNAQEIMRTFDPLKLVREEVSALKKNGTYAPAAERIASEAITGFRYPMRDDSPV